MRNSKDVNIPDDIVSSCSGAENAALFSLAVSKILSVSHAEIIRREAKQAMQVPRKRGRKPKASVSPAPVDQPRA